MGDCRRLVAADKGRERGDQHQNLSLRFLDSSFGSCSGALDPDGLHIHKGMGPKMRKLPTVPAVLDPADRHPRIGRRKPIDEYPTGIEVTGDLASRSDVTGPYIPAQPELACIRRVNCRVDVRYSDDSATGPNVYEVKPCSRTFADLPQFTAAATVSCRVIATALRHDDAQTTAACPPSLNRSP